MAPKEEIKDVPVKEDSADDRLKYRSSLGINYPTLRDHPLHTGYQWLKGKRADDGAEDLWRIHDNLYDLTNFISEHPGGRDWLELTQGTDITEAFEAHHIQQTAHSMLSNFFVKKATTKRNAPFTFEEDGFYVSLRNNIAQELKKIPEEPANRSKLLTDLLLFGFLSTAVIATYLESFFLGAISGILLSLTSVAAHNFFHQRDNIRMYYFDFTLMHSREWRISHALSHHLYTNTINDMEISSPEPFFQYLPHEKPLLFRYPSWVYGPVVYALLFIGHHIKTVAQIVINGKGFKSELLLPYFLLLLMFVLSRQTFLFSVIMFLWIEIVASTYFGIVGVNAAHHHPDIFHDGDKPRPKEEMDWGLYQMDAVMDRKEITGSHFLVLTNFGDHALHHLFPTIDHGKLEYLYPVFLETCKKFGVEWKVTTQLELVKGQYQQLVRNKPKTEAPRPIKASKI